MNLVSRNPAARSPVLAGGDDQLSSLQMMRALAAMSVAFGHTQSEAISLAAANGREFSAALLDLTGAGVDLFFVISGFVMVYASRGLFERPSAAQIFISRRVARIAPLYWAMTSFFLLVMFAAPALISSPRPGWREVASSFLFIPYYRPDEMIMQPVYRLGWTLNYEMFFYVAFACVLWMPMKRALTTLSLGFAALILAGLILAPAPGVFSYWSNPIIVEFVMGAWLGLARVSGARLPPLAAAALAAMGVAGFALQAATGLDAHAEFRPLVWGIPAAAIVAAGVLSTRAITGRGVMPPLVFLGDASYALYLSHPMVLRAMRPLWTKLGLASHVADIWFALAALAIIPLVATALYVGLERPVTRRLQALLKARWASQASNVPSTTVAATKIA